MSSPGGESMKSMVAISFNSKRKHLSHDANGGSRKSLGGGIDSKKFLLPSPLEGT